MKRYEIEILHEPSGAYLNYETETDEPDPNFYESFIRDISVIITNEEEIEESELDTVSAV
jgi:hypothetical protein